MEKEIILELKGINKSFDGIQAVNNFDLILHKKEIVALVGDNGAGKSTLIKIISGVHRKDTGKIFIEGKEAHIENPLDAKKYGIETVYQDEGVIKIFDASSNLFLGREKYMGNFLGRWFKFLDKNYMIIETKKLLQKIGVELKDINIELNSLSGGQRQSVVVGRAVYWGGKVLIFDEPTNNLGVKQEKKVIDLIKRIRDDFDVSIIIISHNINHVFELVDRIVVLRNGFKVGEKIKNETNTNEIVSMITGVL